MNIKILGHTYTIEYNHDLALETGKSGMVVYELEKIKIDNNYSLSSQAETLLSEIIHAIDYHLILKMSERQIHALSEGLYQVHIANDITVILPEPFKTKT